MFQRMQVAAYSAAVLALAVSATAASAAPLTGAALLTSNANAPGTIGNALPVGTTILAQQADFSGSLGPATEYSDNGGPPGQSFTLSSPAMLTAVVVKGGGSTNINNTPMYIQISTLDTGTGAITALDEETATPSGNYGSTDYLTFTLQNMIALTPGVTYGYTIHTNNINNAYYGFTRSADNGSPRYQFNGFAKPQNYDRTFYLVGAAVPEPASLGLLAIGGLALLRRRR